MVLFKFCVTMVYLREECLHTHAHRMLERTQLLKVSRTMIKEETNRNSKLSGVRQTRLYLEVISKKYQKTRAKLRALPRKLVNQRVTS